MNAIFQWKNNSFFLNRLISMIYRHNRIYMDSQLEDINLHSGQYMYLFYLYHHDGQKQDDIAKTLKIDKAGTTRALKKLEKSGYIFRQQDKNDRRGNLVYLTEKAWQVQPLLLSFYSNWLHLALEGFTEEESNTLYQLLNRMAINAISVTAGKEKENE
ncbi:MarR family transcriptional regulator [Clostridiales bacterium COT073_COT-073]|nr:MarR family transcriptional regulator [Clostridiales bacterium COT073_COT-073]